MQSGDKNDLAMDRFNNSVLCLGYLNDVTEETA